MGQDDINPNFDNKIKSTGKHEGMMPYPSDIFEDKNQSSDENPFIQKDVKFPWKNNKNFPEPDPDQFNSPGGYI